MFDGNSSLDGTESEASPERRGIKEKGGSGED
jgi:hypothetical protein